MHLAAAGALDQCALNSCATRAEQHIGLPGLIGELGFVLLVRGCSVEEQLTFGEPAGAQKTIKRGRRQLPYFVLLVGRAQLAQQRGAGAMNALSILAPRVRAFETVDQCGSLWCDGALLAAIIARLGMKRGESVAAVAQRPLEQRVDRYLAANRVRNVVEARGNLLGAPREFPAGQRFQDQRGDESVGART